MQGVSAEEGDELRSKELIEEGRRREGIASIDRIASIAVLEDRGSSALIKILSWTGQLEGIAVERGAGSNLRFNRGRGENLQDRERAGGNLSFLRSQSLL